MIGFSPTGTVPEATVMSDVRFVENDDDEDEEITFFG
jgi:hypothetical protein